MAEGASAIEGLRREIDEIDTAVHDLLIRRAEVATRIGALKNGAGEAGQANGRDSGFLRPGREAMILRRLVQRHHGPLPWPTVVRIWRELMSALVRLQGPFSVAVYAPASLPAEVSGGYWDLARDHFGTHTPTSVHDSALQVLRSVSEGRASVGLLPLPQDDEADPWWRYLMSTDPKTPRILARLPFGAPGVTRGRAPEALVVGCAPAEPTGDDCSLFVLETPAETSRASLREALGAAGYTVPCALGWRPPQEPGLCFHFVELTGFVTTEDERWRSIAARQGNSIHHVWPLGSYAVPLDPAGPSQSSAS